MRTSFKTSAALLAIACSVISAAPAGARPAATPYDLCVFINGAGSPTSSMPEFWSTVQDVRLAIERSPGCRETVVFSASGDAAALDVNSEYRNTDGFIILEKAPFSGLPAKKAEIERVFKEKAARLGALPSARTFLMFEDHGGNGSLGLWRESLDVPDLQNLVAILPGEKTVFHDHCSAASVLGAYIDPKIIGPACAFSISQADEYALGNDPDPLIHALRKGRGFSTVANKMAKGSAQSVVPGRSSDLLLQQFAGDVLDDDVSNARGREMIEALQSRSFPLLAERVRTFEKWLKLNLAELARPKGESDFHRALRLYAHLGEIKTSVEAGSSDAPSVTEEQRLAFLERKHPDLLKRYTEGSESEADDDSPAKRAAERIYESLDCDNEAFAAFVPEACQAHNENDSAGSWLQESYKSVRRAYLAARGMTGVEKLLRSGDTAGLARVEALLDCESRAGL